MVFNGLELTPDQMRFIVEKAQEAQEEHEELRTGAGAEEMAGILEQFKTTLMAGENVPPDLVQRFHAIKGRFHTAEDDYGAELTRIAGEVEEALAEKLLAPYEAAHPQGDLTTMIARHLLDPAIIPLLEEKLARE